MSKINLNIFEGGASASTRLRSSSVPFGIALSFTISWALVTSLFSYSDAWQLVINTATTMLTFVVVYVIQDWQTQDSAVIQSKMSNLVIEGSWASRQIVDIEELSDKELDGLHEFYYRLRNPSQNPQGLNHLLSIEPGVIVQHRKFTLRKELRRTNRNVNITNYEK